MRAWFGAFIVSIAAGVLGCASDSGEPLVTGVAPVVSADEAERLLFGTNAASGRCAAGDLEPRIRCLITARYGADPLARDLALAFFAETGGVPGVLPAQRIDGGWRGEIDLVPELPVGVHRKHLGWALDGMRDIDTFFGSLESAASTRVSYRWRDIDIRFFRSVGRTTPSAFTEGLWEVAYNVSGSLVASGPLVRETLFHEIFHINDWTHNDWSRALAPTVQAIVLRCGTGKTCLAPYTPTDTAVRNGTYYAFQPGPNMVLEYAAELATRYLEEQRAALEGRPYGKPAFKCRTSDNANAWGLLIHEFFGDADLVPGCE